MRWLAVLALVAACGDNEPAPQQPDGAPARCEPRSGTNILARQVAVIHGSVILVTAPRGDLRQFVVEQQGRIWIMDNEQIQSEPFLDISVDAAGPVACCGERGLLGLAFHPQYPTNGIFYVFYTTLTQ